MSIVATNAAGDGPSASFSPVTPYGVPFAPTSLTATPQNQSAYLSWTNSVNNGSIITGYTVTGSGTIGSVSTGSSTSNCTITGLSNGSSYQYYVKATNAAGDGPTATVSVTTYTVPGAPTNLVATLAQLNPGYGDFNKVVLTWGVPSNGGSIITSFTVNGSGTSFSYNNITNGSNINTTSITDLPVGTSLIFSVFATNAAGNGSSAISNTLVPYGQPTISFYNTSIYLDNATQKISAIIYWNSSDNYSTTSPNNFPITDYALVVEREKADGSFEFVANKSVNAPGSSTSFESIDPYDGVNITKYFKISGYAHSYTYGPYGVVSRPSAANPPLRFSGDRSAVQGSPTGWGTGPQNPNIPDIYFVISGYYGQSTYTLSAYWDWPDQTGTPGNSHTGSYRIFITKKDYSNVVISKTVYEIPRSLLDDNNIAPGRAGYTGGVNADFDGYYSYSIYSVNANGLGSIGGPITGGFHLGVGGVPGVPSYYCYFSAS